MSVDARLALVHAATGQHRRWREALEAAGSAAALASLPDSQLRGHGIEAAALRRLRAPDEALIGAWQAWLGQTGHELVTLGEPRYPSRLAETSDAPIALWMRGHTELASSLQLAIVGSRNPTSGGRDNARSFAAYLSAKGLTITSGLALGIDGAGHAGALTGLGSTVAVLGTGIDIVYPPGHAELAGHIAEHGLIVSEYPPGTPARKAHFPQRNRIIAGLAAGVLVVEASRHSGSLITARFASDYGREVFAIPGSIHNPLSRGAHWLIRQGAKLVEEAADILVELAPLHELETPAAAPVTTAGNEAATLSKEYAELLELLAFDPRGIDEIVQSSRLTAAEVSSMLLLLELEGRVEALPGGRYARRSRESG